MLQKMDHPPVALESIQNKHLGAVLIRKERQGSSRFSPAQPPQLERLPMLKGDIIEKPIMNLSKLLLEEKGE